MRSLRPVKSRASPANPALGETDATGAPTAPRKAAAIAAASGTAQQLTTQWDRSSRAQRIDLLSRFIQRHCNSTAAEMEQSLGPAALLFFTRILTWMRLTYQLGFELSVQLSALSLFLQGQRFLSNFAEIGGIEMVTDILCHISPDRVDDRRNALVLLIHLANSGRVYRELICDCDGVDHIIKAALQEKDPKTLEFFTSLFLALGQGNPRKASLVHVGLLELTRHGCDEAALCAAGVLRALQMAREQAAVPPPTAIGGVSPPLALPPIGQGGNSSSSAVVAMPSAFSQPTSAVAHVPVVGVDGSSPESIQRVLDTLFHLLRSDNVKLRFEGVELLSLVSKSLTLVVPVLDRCLQALDETVAVSVAHPAKTGPQTNLLPSLSASARGVAPPTSSGPSDASGKAGVSGLTLDPTPAASELKELKAKAQLRRLQLSSGRALCAILLQPTDEARLRLYRYLEGKGGHMSLVKYLSLCDPRNDTAIDEACNALRLLATVPAVNAGYFSLDAIVERSRTAAYLASVMGKELLGRVLEGPSMSREQSQTLYKALRREGERGPHGEERRKKGSAGAHEEGSDYEDDFTDEDIEDGREGPK